MTGTDKAKKEIIKFGQIAAQRGLSPGISGNISQRCENRIVITRSGCANGFLDEDDFSVIDFDGNVVFGNSKPSSEKMLHIEFYKTRKDINSIFHVHCPYLTAFASCALALDKNILAEIVYGFGKIPAASYALPGSDDLVKSTSKYFQNHDVVLMGNHGVILGAGNIKDAFLKLETCEAYAKTVIFSKILGGAKILPEEEVEKINLLRNK